MRQQKFRSLSAAHKHTDGIYGAIIEDVEGARLSAQLPCATEEATSKRAAISDLAIGAYYNHSRFSKTKRKFRFTRWR